MNATKFEGKAPASAIGTVHPLDGQSIAVTWIAGRRRGRSDVVDLSPLINTHKFYARLRKNPDLFRTVQVMDDGFAIAWGDGSIDMSACSVERLAEEAMTGSDFQEFLKRNLLTHQAAAAALGRSKRQIEHYLQYQALPRMVVLACIGYETRQRDYYAQDRCWNMLSLDPLSAAWELKISRPFGGWYLTIPPAALAQKSKDRCV